MIGNLTSQPELVRGRHDLFGDQLHDRGKLDPWFLFVVDHHHDAVTQPSGEFHPDPRTHLNPTDEVIRDEVVEGTV